MIDQVIFTLFVPLVCLIACTTAKGRAGFLGGLFGVLCFWIFIGVATK